ncbi:MAG: polysaccharide deacetylase family protein [Nitrospirota bacterium]
MSRRFTVSFFLTFLLLSVPAGRGDARTTDNDQDLQVPILLYHRFGTAVVDDMTVTTTVFESHLKYLRDNGYVVIPLRRLVDFYLGKSPPPRVRSVVIVADDGHKSVYTDMFPLIKKYRVPVTLFLYPSAISNASYAMTWDQLREMKRSGLMEFQSHSYWHPNFRKDRKRLKQAEYEKFVDMQLGKSKEKIEKELGCRANMLAWPFGIYDDEIIKRAVKWGYVAAFTMERRHTGSSDNIMALPRYLMINAYKGNTFEMLLSGRLQRKSTHKIVTAYD